jgi:hypothetical protein
MPKNEFSMLGVNERFLLKYNSNQNYPECLPKLNCPITP